MCLKNILRTYFSQNNFTILYKSPLLLIVWILLETKIMFHWLEDERPSDRKWGFVHRMKCVICDSFSDMKFEYQINI